MKTAKERSGQMFSFLLKTLLGGLYTLVNKVSMSAFSRQGRYVNSEKMHDFRSRVDDVVIEPRRVEH